MCEMTLYVSSKVSEHMKESSISIAIRLENVLSSNQVQYKPLQWNKI